MAETLQLLVQKNSAKLLIILKLPVTFLKSPVNENKAWKNQVAVPTDYWDFSENIDIAINSQLC